MARRACLLLHLKMRNNKSFCDFFPFLIITKNGIMHLKTASLHISNHMQSKRKATTHPITCGFSSQAKKK